MRVLFTVLMATCLAFGQAASSWKGDGNSLLQFCSAYVEAANNGQISSRGAIHGTFCIGFLTGIQGFDRMLSQSEIEKNSGRGLVQHACVPASAATDDAVRAVVKWLRDHPEKLNYPASGLALRALHDAFPCKEQ